MSSVNVSEPSVEVARTPTELSAIAQAQAGLPPFFGTLTNDGYCNIWFAGSSHRDWLAMIAYIETKIAISGRQPTSKEREKLRSWRHNYQSVVSRAAVSAVKKPKPASKSTKGLKPAPAESRPVAKSSTSEPIHLGTVSGADSSNSRKRSVGDSAEEEPPTSEQYRVDEGSAASSSGGPVPGGEADYDAQPRSQRTKRAKTMFDPDDPPTKGDYTSASRVGPSVVVAPPAAAMAASDGPDGAVLPAVQLSAPVTVGSSSSSAGANVPATVLLAPPAVVPPVSASSAGSSSELDALDDPVVLATAAHYVSRNKLLSAASSIAALADDVSRTLDDASLRADRLLADARATAEGILASANAESGRILAAANAESSRMLQLVGASGRALRASAVADCKRRLLEAAATLNDVAAQVSATRADLDRELDAAHGGR
jgi:hypothetical protein